MIDPAMYDDFVRLGLKADDTVLMHSSLSSLGHVEGGAQTVIDTLLAVLEDGTLLVPALSFRPVYDTRIFSVKDTPSCVGAISEYFRKRPGVIRSVHPTHSVCGIGRYAGQILSQHIHAETPAGSTSAFALLPKYGGKILMLGCGLGPNTSMHAVEETMEPWFLYMKEPIAYTVYDADGRCFTQKVRRHNFVGNGLHQRYARLAQVMDIPQGKVLEATCHLIPAAPMWEIAQKTMRTNIEYFVEPIK